MDDTLTLDELRQRITDIESGKLPPKTERLTKAKGSGCPFTGSERDTPARAGG
jgi:hypothetical protein